MIDPILATIVLSFITAQGLKIFLFISKGNQKIHWKDLIVTGGMPSTHASVVTGLTLIIYMYSKTSPFFFITLVFSLITLRDAIGVRRAVGEEGKIINQIIEKTKLKLPENHYALGHTPFEVLLGMAIGTACAIGVWWAI